MIDPINLKKHYAAPLYVESIHYPTFIRNHIWQGTDLDCGIGFFTVHRAILET